VIFVVEEVKLMKMEVVAVMKLVMVVEVGMVPWWILGRREVQLE